MVDRLAGAPTAVLLISAWHEGQPSELAARITYTLDATGPDRVTITASGVDAIGDVVRDWLDEIDTAQR
jgi:hypothetical protein